MMAAAALTVALHLGNGTAQTAVAAPGSHNGGVHLPVVVPHPAAAGALTQGAAEMAAVLQREIELQN